MSTTTFVDGVTLTAAAWFNDVDAITYDGTTSQILVGGGAGSIAVWTAATGTGAPMRGTSPSVTTSIVSASTTLAVFNTVATTVNAFGAASTALNIGHASGANTILGATTFSQGVTLSSALTYGGVALSNAVTGTGNMVLSNSPTLTGTALAAAITASGTISTTAGVLMAKGALGAHQTSTVVVHQADADTSRINAYSSSATVAGKFEILQAATDGSPALTTAWDASGNVVFPAGVTGQAGSFTTLAASGTISANATGAGVTFASTGGQNVRMYGGSASHQWDVYGNGTNLRIGDNTGGGQLVVDQTILGSSGIRVGADSTNNMIDDSSTGAGTATLYIGNASINVTSDERIKTNVRVWDGDASAILKALPVKAWDKYLSNDPQGGYEGGYVGFTAQDMHKVAPWSVNTQGDTGLPWQARYEFLNGIIVKGWQDHESQISSLRERIQSLEAQLNGN